MFNRRSPDGRWRAQWLGAKGASALGWTGFVLGNIMRFAAMRFGAQAVLSALTSAQFIVIPVASYFLLGEKVTLPTLACIVVVLLGGCRAAHVSLAVQRWRSHQWTADAPCMLTCVRASCLSHCVKDCSVVTQAMA